ncbi:MAG: hypothetical protein QM708_13585 [Propioniciclava sp.]|uniref:hypothetical protein n=1 Tax=Propioniciclava sp. TaxID=2038686 RepID=UPI0039E4A75C
MNIEKARTQTNLINAALKGDSSAVEPFDLESDPNPTRLLACGLAHTFNALGAVVRELEALQLEVAELRERR